MEPSPDRRHEILIAVLLDPAGEVADIINIASATDAELRAAVEHAASLGFELLIKEGRPRLCADEPSLRAAIEADGGA